MTVKDRYSYYLKKYYQYEVSRQSSERFDMNEAYKDYIKSGGKRKKKAIPKKRSKKSLEYAKWVRDMNRSRKKPKKRKKCK